MRVFRQRMGGWSMFKQFIKTRKVRREMRNLRKLAQRVDANTRVFLLFKLEKLMSEN